MHALAVIAATLIATVGTPKAHNAYVITLTENGQPVTTLPAGTYSIQVRDYSSVHNWALGSITSSARLYTGSVKGTGTKTIVLTLTPGSYAFACSAHPFTMNGKFEVTAPAPETTTTSP